MNSKTILDRLNWIVTFFAGLITVLIVFKEESVQHVFLQPNAFNSLTVLCITIVAAVVYLSTNYYHERKEKELKETLSQEQEDNRKNKLMLDNTKRMLYDINVEKNTDVITGIPNQYMFNEDVERFAKSIQHGELYQIIFIDIDNFGSINDKYGYFKGDALIRAIAQELYYSMRRNESIYKNKFIDNEEPLTEKVYRKYNGGDEFIIVIKGSQDEAVGFLIRLHRQLKAFSSKTPDIISEQFDIDFHAGIAPLYAIDEKPEYALARVEDCFRIAKRKDSNLRIKWFKEIDMDSAGKVYRDAAIEFTKAQSD